jgi:hypothetical protein
LRSISVKLAVELESHHRWNEHRNRLAQHRCFRLDPADAPSKDAKAVDHRGVRIGSNQRVGVGVGLLADDFREDSLRQILEVDLVDDSSVRRHYAEVVQRLLSPAQKRVALLIPLELEVGVDEQGRFASVLVDLHRVIDDEIDGLQRIDQSGISAESGERVAHGGEIDDGGNAGEILEQYSRGAEGNLFLDGALHVPRRESPDVVGLYELAVFIPEKIFEEDLEAEGESVCVPVREFGERVQPKDRVLPTRNVQR